MRSRIGRPHANQTIARFTAKWVYENIITAIDVFSRYAFAYPVSNPTAVNTVKVI